MNYYLIEVAQHNGKPTSKDWKDLAVEMGRPNATLQTQLRRLRQSKDVSQTLKNSLKMK